MKETKYKEIISKMSEDVLAEEIEIRTNYCMKRVNCDKCDFIYSEEPRRCVIDVISEELKEREQNESKINN